MNQYDDLIPEKPDMKVPFHLWLQEKYREWVTTQIGRGKNMSEVRQKVFAEHLGITENTLSQYLLGKRDPTGPAIDLLADKLGAEVYDRLGIPRRVPKNKVTYFVMDNLRYLDENEIKELIERIKNRKAERASRKTKLQVQEESDNPRFA